MFRGDAAGRFRTKRTSAEREFKKKALRQVLRRAIAYVPKLEAFRLRGDTTAVGRCTFVRLVRAARLVALGNAVIGALSWTWSIRQCKGSKYEAVWGVQVFRGGRLAVRGLIEQGAQQRVTGEGLRYVLGSLIIDRAAHHKDVGPHASRIGILSPPPGGRRRRVTGGTLVQPCSRL